MAEYLAFKCSISLSQYIGTFLHPVNVKSNIFGSRSILLGMEHLRVVLFDEMNIKDYVTTSTSNKYLCLS